MNSSVYSPIIDSMTWSYSRLKLFETCRYAWYLKYLYGINEPTNFYASYGSFIHNLIERYYRDEISHKDLPLKFLVGFSNFVKGKRPNEEIVDKYLQAGYEYFADFKPMPFDMVSVEQKITFDVGGYPFVGYVDFIGMRDGALAVVDHKSRNLSKRSTRRKPTLKDKELDEFMRQLYLYSIGVNDVYGQFPTTLCFNCFKSKTFIEEPFKEDAYNEAIEWAKDSIETIKHTDDFYPTLDWFYCTNLCGMKHECCYYALEMGGRR